MLQNVVILANCRKSGVMECIFAYMSLDFECKCNKNPLLQCYLLAFFSSWVRTKEKLGKSNFQLLSLKKSIKISTLWEKSIAQSRCWIYDVNINQKIFKIGKIIVSVIIKSGKLVQNLLHGAEYQGYALEENPFGYFLTNETSPSLTIIFVKTRLRSKQNPYP